MVRLVGLEPTRPKAQGLSLVSIPISLQARYLERVPGYAPGSLHWQCSVIASIRYPHKLWLPHEDSNRAFLIQSQASYQIDDGAKISAGSSLKRHRITSMDGGFTPRFLALYIINGKVAVTLRKSVTRNYQERLHQISATFYLSLEVHTQHYLSHI